MPTRRRSWRSYSTQDRCSRPSTADDVDHLRCKEIQQRYSDQPIGVVDASVLALIERLREDKLATLDHRHFSVVRPAHVESLRLLPRTAMILAAVRSAIVERTH